MKTPVSFKLRTDLVQKLKEISDKTKLSQTAIMETLLENAQYTAPIQTAQPAQKGKK